MDVLRCCLEGRRSAMPTSTRCAKVFWENGAHDTWLDLQVCVCVLRVFLCVSVDVLSASLRATVLRLP
jgi:hypothetical protein